MTPPSPGDAVAPQAPSGAVRIAVLEDDQELREAILLPTLRDHGFEATGAGTAAGLYRLMIGQQFDMVLLDIGLPDESGLEVVKHLRGLFPTLGIVMLTGSRGRDKRVRALVDGADAFLAKPVDGDVLAATLRSVARRILAAPETVAAPAPTPSVARWRLEADDWCLVAPNGGKLALARAERVLLQSLFAAVGQPVARQALMDALGEDSGEFDSHRLDMLVHRLRGKAARMAGEEGLPLLATRGIGYLFAG